LSRTIFSDDCPACRPVILDAETGRPVAPDHPLMRAVNDVWGRTTFEQRRAFHRPTCQGSLEPTDLLTVNHLRLQMQAAATEASAH
jgi:hypothetical protein